VTGSDPNPTARIDGFAARLSSLQVKRPAIPLVSAGIITALMLVAAFQLRLNTGFESLLPESKPSVLELKRVSALTSGVSTVFIVLEGGPTTPTTALRQAGDALVPEVEKLGPEWVGHAEAGVHEAVRFLAPRAGLFLSLEQLTDLQKDIDSRYAKAVVDATGMGLGLDEEDQKDQKDQGLDLVAMREKLRIEGADPDRYPDGYYQSKDGKTLIVLIRTPIKTGDFVKGAQLLKKLEDIVAAAKLERFDPHITVGYAGDLETSQKEFESINRDLTEVGIFGAILIGGVVLAYYLRVRTVAIMLVTIGVGVAWTFGATWFTVGKLNIATGFLFTIIAGNGINFGIIYMARYLEARRNGLDLLASITLAHRETWTPTLTAGAAAAASYGSLGATDFRGFHDFGLIGGIGMLLCWVATYWVLPSLLTVAERLVPLDKDFGGPLSRLRKVTQGGVGFGRPFEYLVSRWSKPIAIGGALLTVAGVYGTVHWIRTDPMDYDLRNMRTDMSARANEMRIDQLGNEITGHVGANGMAILVDRVEQVPMLIKALDARRDAAPADQKPFKRLHALQDFVPDDQADKIPVLMKIRAKLIKAHARGGMAEKDWEQIEKVLPPDDLKPFGLADLPEGVARAFTETDGTRGRIVYISPTDLKLIDDAHYLFRWADSYRETVLPDGSKVLGSGRAVIYADMWTAVVEDVPKAVVLSFLAVVLVVLVAFRGGRSSIAVLASLLVGVSWMVALLVLFNVKLNFTNFVALPITFGIGVDYAVNVVQRYVREGRGSALLSIRETGGAVILCSLTTTLGYLALVRSMNFAVRSLGVAAFFGEVCCLLASVLVLPAVLMWADQNVKPKSDAPTEPAKA